MGDTQQVGETEAEAEETNPLERARELMGHFEKPSTEDLPEKAKEILGIKTKRPRDFEPMALMSDNHVCDTVQVIGVFCPKHMGGWNPTVILGCIICKDTFSLEALNRFYNRRHVDNIKDQPKGEGI